jgi:hypothetical protein
MISSGAGSPAGSGSGSNYAAGNAQPAGLASTSQGGAFLTSPHAGGGNNPTGSARTPHNRRGSRKGPLLPLGSSGAAPREPGTAALKPQRAPSATENSQGDGSGGQNGNAPAQSSVAITPADSSRGNHLTLSGRHKAPDDADSVQLPGQMPVSPGGVTVTAASQIGFGSAMGEHQGPPSSRQHRATSGGDESRSGFVSGSGGGGLGGNGGSNGTGAKTRASQLALVASSPSGSGVSLTGGQARTMTPGSSVLTESAVQSGAVGAFGLES